MAVSLRHLNAAATEEFVATAEFLVENSAWVLASIAARRPFASQEDLCDAIEAEIRAAAPEEKVQLFNAHPELAGVEAQAGTMTDASTGEQGRLGLTSLDASNHTRLLQLNARYRVVFGFPFIIALRRQPSLQAVFSEFERRLGNTMTQEITETIGEIMKVVRGRATRIVNDGISATTKQT